MKIVDGIDMAKVKADELKKMIGAFNKAKVGMEIKMGANPLGSAKAFVKAVESLDDDKQAMLPESVADYYNLIVIDEEELAKLQGKGAPEAAEVKADKIEAIAKADGKGKPPALKAVEKPKPKAPAAAASKKPQPKADGKKIDKAPPKAKAEKKTSERSAIEDSHLIKIVPGKEPKKPGTKVYEQFQLYKKCKTVGAYIKAGGSRKEISFDRYHGRITLE
jgi:hypothetical protein